MAWWGPGVRIPSAPSRNAGVDVQIFVGLPLAGPGRRGPEVDDEGTLPLPTDHADSPAVGGTAPADLVIAEARVRCAPGSDGRARWAAGVAVRDGRIVAVGTADDVRALAGPATRVIRAPGRLVLPAFQDSHVHAPFAGRNRLRVWLNDLAGRTAYLDAVAAYAAAYPHEPWMIGGGWALEYFPGGTPRKADLDAIVPGPSRIPVQQGRSRRLG